MKEASRLNDPNWDKEPVSFDIKGENENMEILHDIIISYL